MPPCGKVLGGGPLGIGPRGGGPLGVVLRGGGPLLLLIISLLPSILIIIGGLVPGGPRWELGVFIDTLCLDDDGVFILDGGVFIIPYGLVGGGPLGLILGGATDPWIVC